MTRGSRKKARSISKPGASVLRRQVKLTRSDKRSRAGNDIRASGASKTASTGREHDCTHDHRNSKRKPLISGRHPDMTKPAGSLESGVGRRLIWRVSRQHGRDPATRRELFAESEKGDRQGDANEGAGDAHKKSREQSRTRLQAVKWRERNQKIRLEKASDHEPDQHETNQDEYRHRPGPELNKGEKRWKDDGDECSDIRQVVQRE